MIYILMTLHKTNEIITLTMVILSYIAGNYYLSDDFSKEYSFIIWAIFAITYPFVLVKIMYASWGERFIYLQVFLAM